MTFSTKMIKKYSLYLSSILLLSSGYTHAQEDGGHAQYDRKHYQEYEDRSRDELVIIPPYPYQEIGTYPVEEDWDALEESLRRARKAEKHYLRSLNKRDRKAYKRQKRAERKEARKYYKFLRKEAKKADKAYAKTLNKRDRKEFKRMRKQERKHMKRWVRYHFGGGDD